MIKLLEWVQALDFRQILGCLLPRCDHFFFMTLDIYLPDPNRNAKLSCEISAEELDGESSIQARDAGPYQNQL
jgi:hypothetical protein